MLQGMVGMVLFVGIAFLVSENRKKVPIRLIAVGMILQVAIAWIMLRFSICQELFEVANRVVFMIQNATLSGTGFVFGYLGGGPLPFSENAPGAAYVMGLQALPLILVMSALSALFFYWGILPRVVKGFSSVLARTMKTGGAEGLGVSANIFVGMVESPLLIRPYLSQMTRSELFTLMTTGMATIAGTVMVLYANILSSAIPGIMGHILTASLISVPAAIVIAKVMVPETDTPTSGQIELANAPETAMEAITEGTVQGVQLLIQVTAMLIVLVALVHLLNQILEFLPMIGDAPLTLQRILGWIMSPVAWAMGIPWNECLTAGSLLGTKTILNEFLAYLELARTGSDALSPRSMLILTYALCGFANPGSLGIMIGGMGSMAPDRRGEIVAMGLRSVLSGTLATCLTGCVVGIISH